MNSIVKSNRFRIQFIGEIFHCFEPDNDINMLLMFYFKKMRSIRIDPPTQIQKTYNYTLRSSIAASINENLEKKKENYSQNQSLTHLLV